jgi:hypothetical protein
MQNGDWRVRDAKNPWDEWDGWDEWDKADRKIQPALGLGILFRIPRVGSFRTGTIGPTLV